MYFYKIFKTFLGIICVALLLSACNGMPSFKNKKGAILEPDGKKRAQQNVIEGRGIKLFNKNKGNGKFLFASSNPMWKASIETLSFISLANVDYSGGIIITDWYSEPNTNDSIKITIRFLSNEIRADGLIVQIHKRSCNNNGNNCNITEIKNELIFDIKDKIIRKAAIFKTQSDKIAKENKPTKVFKAD